MDVHAVAIAFGRERSGVLNDLLSQLTDSCPHEAQAHDLPFFVSEAWVRAVGPIGVVMLRFQTDETTYRTIARRANAYSNSDTTRGRILIHRAHGSDGAQAHTEAVTAAWTKTESLADSAYRQFVELVNILAADTRIQIASQDWVESPRNHDSTHITVHASLRLIDTGHRGPHYLQSAIKAAQDLAVPDPDKSFKFIGRVSPNTHDGISYLNNSIHKPTHTHDARAYVFVHAFDCPGLLAMVTKIVEHEGALIHRSCSRGLGGHGIVIMDTSLKCSASHLESRLRHTLPEYIQSATGPHHYLAKRLGSQHRTGVWTASVTETPTEPESTGAPRSEYVPKLLHVPDRPGLILHVSNTVATVNAIIDSPSHSVSFYFLDGHRTSQSGDGASNDHDFAVGVGLSVPKLESLSRAGTSKSLSTYIDEVWDSFQENWKSLHNSPMPFGEEIPHIPSKLGCYQDWWPAQVSSQQK